MDSNFHGKRSLLKQQCPPELQLELVGKGLRCLILTAEGKEKIEFVER